MEKINSFSIFPPPPGSLTPQGSDDCDSTFYVHVNDLRALLKPIFQQGRDCVMKNPNIDLQMDCIEIRKKYRLSEFTMPKYLKISTGCRYLPGNGFKACCGMGILKSSDSQQQLQNLSPADNLQQLQISISLLVTLQVTLLTHPHSEIHFLHCRNLATGKTSLFTERGVYLEPMNISLPV